jgi:pimeloyl-ACP methyl ester carboxylesterase
MRATLLVLGLTLLGAPGLARGPVQPTSVWRDLSPHQLRWVTVDSSVRLEVLDWEGSGPPLVLLGCYISAHSYDEFAPKLTNQFHVFGITRRGIGASDKPASGYTVQRSVDDLLEVLNALEVRKPLLVGNSCAGQVLTMFVSQHPDRVSGLVYLDGAGDPLMTPADVGVTIPHPATLPRPIKDRPPADNSSFDALRRSQRNTRGWAFPEAELRQQYVENPDGSVGPSRLSPVIRRAITTDARVKPDYSRIRVPVLAIYQREPPFEQVAGNYLIRNEQERAALRQEYAATRALYDRWQQDLLAAIPTARIVELTGASLYMFLSHEADVLREIRTFAASMPKGNGSVENHPGGNSLLLFQQSSVDEKQLLMIQQQLARAWVERDRAIIERVLAPEWSVTQADGTIRSRAAVLHDAFVVRTVSVESMIVDDVTVTLLGDTAIVRGRTQATGVVGDRRGSARLRFTDTFMKRNGQWQAVASHATTLVR